MNTFSIKKIGHNVLLWMWKHLWLWILLALLLFTFAPTIISDWRLKRNHIETTAHVRYLYKSGKSHNIKCVAYYYCVDNEWYDGHTSPPDSIWDNIQPYDLFEIVYEKGNPSNSNWAGYYTK